MSGEDYLLEAAIAALSGGAKAYDKYTDTQREEALMRKKIKLEEESKIRVAEKTPRDVYNQKTGQFETRYGGAITQLKSEPNVKEGKTLISNNDFNRGVKEGKEFTSDKYQVVPESYAGEGSPFAEQGRQKIIKSYADGLESNKEYQSSNTVLDSSTKMKEFLDLAQNEKNEVAFSNAKTMAAKNIGEVGMLSESDVRRYAEASSLIRKYSDRWSTWTEGVPKDATIDEMRAISEALAMKAEERKNKAIGLQADKMSANLGISKSESYRYLGYPMKEESKPKKVGLPPLGTGKPDKNKDPLGLGF